MANVPEIKTQGHVCKQTVVKPGQGKVIKFSDCEPQNTVGHPRKNIELKGDGNGNIPIDIANSNPNVKATGISNLLYTGFGTANIEALNTQGIFYAGNEGTDDYPGDTLNLNLTGSTTDVTVRNLFGGHTKGLVSNGATAKMESAWDQPGNFAIKLAGSDSRIGWRKMNKDTDDQYFIKTGGAPGDTSLVTPENLAVPENEVSREIFYKRD